MNALVLNQVPTVRGRMDVRVVRARVPWLRLLAAAAAAVAVAAPARGPVAAAAHDAAAHGVAAHGAGPMAAGQALLIWGGRERTYRLYAPPAPAPGVARPLVLVLHGGGGTGAAMERLTLGRFNRLADRDGAVVAYPDGVDRHWNDGRGVAAYAAHAQNVDDVGFLAALVDHLVRTAAADPRRVYVAGISNGGLMAFRFAREASDRVAAIAPVAISMAVSAVPLRDPARPVSVLMIAGTDDPLVPWRGGTLGVPGPREAGRVLSVPESVRYWTGVNSCPPVPDVAMEPDRDPNDGTRVRRETYAPCREGTEVVLYAVEGGGHTWPGGPQYLPARLVGRTSRDIDATAVIWEFFRRHARH